MKRNAFPMTATHRPRRPAAYSLRTVAAFSLHIGVCFGVRNRSQRGV